MGNEQKTKTLPTFDELADFIRQQTGTSLKKEILPATQFENDLRITGDDGVELLEAVEQHFGIPLTDEDGQLSRHFGLGSSEYLFHSEGFSLLPPLWWFGIGQKPIIRPFTVGELYAGLRAQCTD